VAGSKVPVRRLYAFYRSGTSVERLLKRYPQLEPAKVFDALAFALDNPEVIEADIAREQELLAERGQQSAANAASAKQIELPFDGDSDPEPKR
jgi:uncharacterized protein (DUF433 family)